MGIGINGLGRIGRLVLRRLLSNKSKHTDVRVINSPYPPETVAHLLKYDSIHGRYDADISVSGGRLIVNGSEIAVICERDPRHIPWAALGAAIVIEATGKFSDRAGAVQHLGAGADKVIVTAPGKLLDFTAVMGVNDDQYDPARHHLISTASCTTNCVAPVLHAIDQAFGVVDGWITSVHAFTSDQRHLDNPHRDLRRARACTQSIIPTTTGIGQALADVLPHLAPSISGLSLRVPVSDVSLADMTLTLRLPVDADCVMQALRSAAGDGYIAVSDEPLVSSDYIGDSRSAVVDGLSLACSGERLKLLAWYDNEWGYSCRVAEMAERVSAAHGGRITLSTAQAAAIPAQFAAKEGERA